MTDDSLLLHIDEAGQITVEGRGAQRRLSQRPGRYRLVPSVAALVILERQDGDGAQATPASRILLSGDIAAVGGLIDVLHLVSTSRWSGQCTVIDGPVRKTVYFHQGDVLAAASNVPEDRIGSILYRFGLITAQQLEATLAKVTQETRFGQILVDEGIVTTHTLYQYVRKQIEEIFHSVLAIRSGEFYFYRSDEEAPPSQLHLSTAALLLDGVRRIDEMNYFREKIPSSNVVPVRIDKIFAELPNKVSRVLELVDGHRDVGSIARESHLGEFETTKLLYHLLRSGNIEVRAPMVPQPTRPSPVSGAKPQPGESLARIVGAYNEAYAQITAEVAARMPEKAAALQRGLASFFSSKSEFASLFVGVSAREDGTLPADALLGNLEIAPVAKRLDYLYRALDELLSFLLFNAGEVTDRRHHAELSQRLQEILQQVPRGA